MRTAQRRRADHPRSLGRILAGMGWRGVLLVLVGPSLVLLGFLAAWLYQLLGPVLLCACVGAIVTLAWPYLRSRRSSAQRNPGPGG